VGKKDRGAYVSAKSMVEARERMSRREGETDLSEEELAASDEAARKHLRESTGGLKFERTGEVKQGVSPKYVRRELSIKDFERMNLPKEHRRARSRGIQDEEVRKVVFSYGSRVVEMVRSATGLIIDGDAGAGKSSIAAILAKEAVRWGFSAYFVSHEELGDLRFEDRRFAEGMSVMGRVRSADFLVLDNFDGRFLSDKRFGPIELEKLVQRRNANLLTTVITTRVGERMAAKKEGVEIYPGLMSTLDARTATISVYGNDMRLKSAKDAHARVFEMGEG
jgi:DNA replication protein DnaC